MKQLDKKQRSLLAGEYVLGLLSERARLRFEELQESDPLLQNEVLFWQHHFAELTELLPAIKPPDSVWQNVSDRITPQEKNQKRASIFSPEFWQGFALAGLMSLTVGYFVFNSYIASIQPTITVKKYVAVLQNSEAKPVLIASLDETSQTLMIENLKPTDSGPGHDLQVWCFPNEKDPPMSVGLLQGSGTTEFVLSDEQLALLHEASGLAISMEPEGGSEQPTGEIMYRGLSI